MDSSGLIVPNVQYAITHRYVDVAMLALIFCEHIATFTDEIRFIWRHRFTSISVLYVLSRYGLLVLGVLMVVNDSLVDLPLQGHIENAMGHDGPPEHPIWRLLGNPSLCTKRQERNNCRHRFLRSRGHRGIKHLPVGSASCICALCTVQRLPGRSAPIAIHTDNDRLNRMMTVQGVLYVLSDVTVIAFTVYSTMGTLRKAPARAKVQFAIVFMRDGSIYFATMLVLSLYSFVYPMVTAIPLPWMMSLLST
ncbi:hypothetical protein PsYK624_045610 [Phanerochaete sordida]|uniref:DUF6533 domain-containing protein n=1 Tax=Phanerochaete sordida TaxID=48140 RepID=A0A9P3G558_9APHY|nr:hypothetical protein PsYK624_045610 [Phanerochaete sordida]